MVELRRVPCALQGIESHRYRDMGSFATHAGPIGPVQPPTADLSLTLVGKTSWRIHRSVEYGFRVRNNGPDAASNVILKARYPTNVRIDSTSVGPGGSCSVNAATRTYTCTFASIPSGKRRTLDLTLTFTTAGTYKFTDSANGSSPPDPVSSNNSASLTTTVTR